jgi:hypothetical protein
MIINMRLWEERLMSIDGIQIWIWNILMGWIGDWNGDGIACFARLWMVKFLVEIPIGLLILLGSLSRFVIVIDACG